MAFVLFPKDLTNLPRERVQEAKSNEHETQRSDVHLRS